MRTPVSILVGILFIVATGLYLQHRTSPASSQTPSLSTHLPTYEELQRELVRRGHKIKVDGKMCEGWNDPNHSETLKAYDIELGHQYNQEICKKMGE